MGEMFIACKKRGKAQKSRIYRAKCKDKAIDLEKVGTLKCGKFGGAKKVCMRVHQYDLPELGELKRIAQLGTCPAARGSFFPTARIASHMPVYLR